MKFKTITSILNESTDSDLFKCYLVVRKKSGHKWLTYKDYASSKFFIKVTEDNIDDIIFDKDLPILNYSNRITNEVLKRGCKLENVYNKPKFIKQSGSKETFHKLIGDDVNIPKTYYNKSDALKLGFPMIAKPTDGHSGIGILVFKNEKEFNSADHSKIDIYSQYIDKASEHRFICFKGDIIVWLERTPLNDKAKSGSTKSDEIMNFKYIKQNINNVPNNYKKLLKKFCDIISDLPYICFDVMEDKDGKLYIIESNCQPGVPFDTTVLIYKKIFKDFYNRPVNKKTDEILNKYGEILDNKTIDSDGKRFEIKL